MTDTAHRSARTEAHTTDPDRAPAGESEVRTVDVVVIGAGFGGLYALHKLRELGYQAMALEMGQGVGGTWYWNRYPGARVDVEGFEYSFSFSKELEDEWDWSELMPAQAELERYANHVADRFDLRRDIAFGQRVRAMTWSESERAWEVVTDAGMRVVARFVIAATGCLSAPLTPAIEGIDSFSGPTLYTNRFPAGGFDFTGTRVAIVGTGSSGVQAIPVIAAQAAHTTVFQRSAAFTRPANNRPVPLDEMQQRRAGYPELRRQQRESASGTLHFGAVSLPSTPPPDAILTTAVEERLARIDVDGWGAPWAWSDIMADVDANRAGVELYGELVRRVVHDPDTAASLVPQYPLGCKRLIIDTDYFATFNRPNVDLVDLRKGGIERITSSGVQTAQGFVEVDVIVFATGFDAMTGALDCMEITGTDGRLLRDEWADGPRSLLGLQVEGFPNLFTVTGPGSPSVHTNMIMAIEQHIDWIGDCLVHLRATGRSVIEPTPEAQDAWVAHVASLVDGTIRASEACNSWYTGANVPGKPRVYLAYIAGLPAYRTVCDEVADDGYRGFVLR